MIFDIFGTKRKKEEKRKKFLEEQLARWDKLVATLDPSLRAAALALPKIDVDSFYKDQFRDLIRAGDLEGAREYFVSNIFSRASEDTGAILKSILVSERWMNVDDLIDAGLSFTGNDDVEDELILGTLPVEEDSPNGPSVCFKGEGHLLTVAPTRSGKGQRFIIRNLLRYKGPAVILDPKGENYRETAERRAMFGPVFKFDPFELLGSGDCYNPIATVDGWEDAVSLADLLVVPTSRDKFWDAAGKELLAGLIYYVRTLPDPEKRNIAEIVRHLSLGKSGLDDLANQLQKSADERLRLLGNRIEAEPENLFLSILATLRAQLDIWLTDAIANTTSSTSMDWDMNLLWEMDRNTVNTAPSYGVPPGPRIEAGERIPGGSATIYLVIPPEKIEAYQSVLRVMIGQHINQIIEIHGKQLSELEADPDTTPDAVERLFRCPRWPWLFVLDELPQLGYLSEIERGVSIVGGVDIRLWLITQDMAQLSEVYPRWESILANCKGQVYFQPNDQKTADIISTRLGATKNLWGEEEPLAESRDLMGPEFAEKAVIVFATQKPIKANLPIEAYKDEDLKNHIREELAQWNAAVPQWEEEERTLWYPKDMEGLNQTDLSDEETSTDDATEPNSAPSGRPLPPGSG